MDESTGLIDPFSPVFDATSTQLVHIVIKRRPLNPPKDSSTPDPLLDWQEVIFRDVLTAFCALPNSNIPEHEPSAPALEAWPREKATDKFTYCDMLEHTDLLIIYIYIYKSNRGWLMMQVTVHGFGRSSQSWRQRYRRINREALS